MTETYIINELPPQLMSCPCNLLIFFNLRHLRGVLESVFQALMKSFRWILNDYSSKQIRHTSMRLGWPQTCRRRRIRTWSKPNITIWLINTWESYYIPECTYDWMIEFEKVTITSHAECALFFLQTLWDDLTNSPLHFGRQIVIYLYE